MSSDGITRVRVDKWLWAARFFKTRGLAAQAIETGKVEVNGERAKRSKQLQVGDELRVRLGPYHHVIKVLAVSENRGPAAVAATLFAETEESRKARETLHMQMKIAQSGREYDFRGRPTKKDRRDIEKLKRRGDY